MKNNSFNIIPWAIGIAIVVVVISFVSQEENTNKIDMPNTDSNVVTTNEKTVNSRNDTTQPTVDTTKVPKGNTSNGGNFSNDGNSSSGNDASNSSKSSNGNKASNGGKSSNASKSDNPPNSNTYMQESHNDGSGDQYNFQHTTVHGDFNLNSKP